MSYAAAADMIARYSSRDLIQLTNDDPAAQSVNATALIQALDDASAEIDGYLDGRFALPLADPPAVLNRLACDIAMYRLQALRPLHDMADARKRYDDAVAFLSAAARGEVTLGLAPDNREPASAVAVNLAGPSRVFGRRNLRGY